MNKYLKWRSVKGAVACLVFLSISVLYGYSGTVRPYDSLIRSLAEKHGLSASLIHAMIKNESNYNPFAVSSKGAKGLMQLMPNTANKYGVEDLYDPKENIEAGIKYMKNLLSSYEGNLNLALAAYNAGPEAVKKFKGVPPYPETQNYIKKINSSFHKSNRRLQKSIYTYYNESGRLVITNIPHLKKSNRRRILQR